MKKQKEDTLKKHICKVLPQCNKYHKMMLLHSLKNVNEDNLIYLEEELEWELEEVGSIVEKLFSLENELSDYQEYFNDNFFKVQLNYMGEKSRESLQIAVELESIKLNSYTNFYNMNYLNSDTYIYDNEYLENILRLIDEERYTFCLEIDSLVELIELKKNVADEYSLINDLENLRFWVSIMLVDISDLELEIETINQNIEEKIFVLNEKLKDEYSLIEQIGIL